MARKKAERKTSGATRRTERAAAGESEAQRGKNPEKHRTKSLPAMKKTELVEYGRKLGLALDMSMTKTKLLEMIRRAEQEQKRLSAAPTGATSGEPVKPAPAVSAKPAPPAAGKAAPAAPPKPVSTTPVEPAPVVSAKPAPPAPGKTAPAAPVRPTPAVPARFAPPAAETPPTRRQAQVRPLEPASPTTAARRPQTADAGATMKPPQRSLEADLAAPAPPSPPETGSAMDHQPVPSTFAAPPLPEPAVSPYIEHGPPLPEAYAMDRLVALVRDPEWLFAYWELTGGRLDQVRAELSGGTFEISRWVLRLVVPSRQETWDLDVDARAGNWYIKVLPDARYKVLLGVVTPQGRFVEVCAAEEVSTPPIEISSVVDEAWMVVRQELERLLELTGCELRPAASMGVATGVPPSRRRVEVPRAIAFFSGLLARLPLMMPAASRLLPSSPGGGWPRQ